MAQRRHGRARKRCTKRNTCKWMYTKESRTVSRGYIKKAPSEVYGKGL